MKRIAALTTIAVAGLATAASALPAEEVLPPAPTILVEDFSYITIDGLSNDTVAGTPLYTTDGERIGEVEMLNDDYSVIVGVGGWLGLGEYDIRLPKDRVAWFEGNGPDTEFRVYIDASQDQLLEIDNEYNG